MTAIPTEVLEAVRRKASGSCMCRGSCHRHGGQCGEFFGQLRLDGSEIGAKFVHTSRNPRKVSDKNTRLVCEECAKTWEPWKGEVMRRAERGAAVVESYTRYLGEKE